MGNPSSLTGNTWNKNPTKLAILQAMHSCQSRLGRIDDFSRDIADALAQKWVWTLHSYSSVAEEVHYETLFKSSIVPGYSYS